MQLEEKAGCYNEYFGNRRKRERKFIAAILGGVVWVGFTDSDTTLLSCSDDAT